MSWRGYVAQVRERYWSHHLPLEIFGRHLAVAVKLDEGILPPQEEIPSYLRDRNGIRLVAECSCRKGARCLNCIEKDGLV